MWYCCMRVWSLFLPSMHMVCCCSLLFVVCVEVFKSVCFFSAQRLDHPIGDQICLA